MTVDSVINCKHSINMADRRRRLLRDARCMDTHHDLGAEGDSAARRGSPT